MRDNESLPLLTWFNMIGTRVCTPVRPDAQFGQGNIFFSRECGA